MLRLVKSILITVLVFSATVNAAVSFYDEDFSTAPPSPSWRTLEGATFDITSNPGYGTVSDTDGGWARVSRWWYNSGATAEWDLEVRLVPINKNQSVASGPYMGIHITDAAGGHVLDLGYFVDRFSQADGIMMASNATNLHLPGVSETFTLVTTEPLSLGGSPSFVSEVFLKFKKRYSTPQEVADNGRIYCYYKYTVDPNNGGQPVTSDWQAACYQSGANYGWTQNGPIPDDLTMDMYCQDIGALQVLYDFMYLRPSSGQVVPEFCGDFNTTYDDMDFDHDCYVGYSDLLVMVNEWLVCTDPADSLCDGYWLE